MIIADGFHLDKGDRTLEQWVQEERVMVAREILRRIPPAVRQAMTTLDAIETGTQSLMRRIGRHITEALMEAPVPESSSVCRECASPLRQVDSRRSDTLINRRVSRLRTKAEGSPPSSGHYGFTVRYGPEIWLRPIGFQITPDTLPLSPTALERVNLHGSDFH